MDDKTKKDYTGEKRNMRLFTDLFLKERRDFWERTGGTEEEFIDYLESEADYHGYLYMIFGSLLKEYKEFKKHR